MEWTTLAVRIPAQPFLETEEVAALVKVKEPTLRKWVREGRFPAPKRPGLWSGETIGLWLAYQDRVAGLLDDEDDAEGENDQPPGPPVKRKPKIPDVHET